MRGRQGLRQVLDCHGIDAHDSVGGFLDQVVEAVQLHCLHQTQVAAGRVEARRARDGAQQRHMGLVEQFGGQPGMAGAGDAVQDDARDRHVFAQAGASQSDGGGCLGLAAHVNHQHHRQSQHGGEVRGGARPALAAVKQAHDALNDHQVGVAGQERVDQVRPHGPGIEIDGGAAGGGLMKAWVDIVGAAFRARHVDAHLAETREQPQRHQSLAAAGGRRGDNKTFGHGLEAVMRWRWPGGHPAQSTPGQPLHRANPATGAAPPPDRWRQ